MKEDVTIRTKTYWKTVSIPVRDAYFLAYILENDPKYKEWNNTKSLVQSTLGNRRRKKKAKLYTKEELAELLKSAAQVRKNEQVYLK